MIPGSRLHATTIVGVRRNNRLALGGDGQVSFDETIFKSGARKIRKLCNGTVLAGFAGAAADAFTLFDRFENKLTQEDGDLLRAVVALAREWRLDKYLRHLDALLTVADARHMLIISGSGDILEPDDQIVAIGSGAPYALAAARALVQNTRLQPASVVRKSLEIAAGICVYTNDHIQIEIL
jgi:ATP-dependent HslUV protease subunit HslV